MQDRNLSSRERILETAVRRFYRSGFRAVGVDTVVAKSGMGKMTLCRHFLSKDDLIGAYLEGAHRRFWLWFDEVADQVV